MAREIHEAWAKFMRDSADEIQRNEYSRGLVFEATPGATTIDAVREYMVSFGYQGAVARDVVAAVGPRNNRRVELALKALVEDGELRVVEEPTRGPKATPRKRYYPTAEGGPLWVSMPYDY